MCCVLHLIFSLLPHSLSYSNPHPTLCSLLSRRRKTLSSEWCWRCSRQLHQPTHNYCWKLSSLYFASVLHNIFIQQKICKSTSKKSEREKLSSPPRNREENKKSKNSLRDDDIISIFIFSKLRLNDSRGLTRGIWRRKISWVQAFFDWVIF